jgi:(R,R)-butanediol dehydrogenase / meso-butanediol dehydrogenase / diacetyl reductase
MIAAQLHGREDLRVEDVPEPEPGPGEVKVAVAHNGLCGTDLHEYFDGPMACTDEPHPLTGGVLPQIMGHEFAGVVSGLGAGVTGIAVGDRVSIEPLYYCRECDACTSGLTRLCDNIITHGICSNGGGMAQQTVVPAWMIHHLPSSVNLAQGALIEPLAVAFNGALRSGTGPGDSVVVLGAGPIGIGVTLGLRALGVEKLFVVEPAATRRAAMSDLGIEHVIDPTGIDVAAEVKRRNGGRGVHAAIDCAGAAATFSVAPSVLRVHGRYVILAFVPAEVPFQPWLLARSEIELTGSCGYGPGVFTRVIDMMADGTYPTTGWVEHVRIDEASDALSELRDGLRMKLLVDLPVPS